MLIPFFNRLGLRADASLPVLVRGLCSVAASDMQVKDVVSILPMPRLSHHMQEGRLKRWFKSEGDQLKPYDVVAEVETSTLIEDAYKVDHLAGSVSLLIETQDEGFMGKIMVQEGSSVTVGTPLALICEHEEHLEQTKLHECQVSDVYNTEEPVKILTWQSYLQAGEGSTRDSGCM